MLRRSCSHFQYAGEGAVQGRFQTIRGEQMRQVERLQKTSARFSVEKLDESTLQGNRTFIGIDLGTTNSCVSYIDGKTKKPRIIPSPTGSWVFPTAITFDRNHQVRVFGEEARGVARTSSSATLCSGKRLIGRRFGELQKVTDQMSKTNTLTFDETGQVSIECAGRVYNLVHVTGMFLRYLKTCAEEFLKQPVDAAVVSVPAHFSPQQKVATEDAALIAGFDVLEIIDEPSAACLAYTVLRPASRVPEKSKSGSNIETSVVFDLGGGTLDCALMDHDKTAGRFALAATHGDPLLGGNDWDNLLARHIADNFERKWKVDLDAQDANPGKVAGDQRNLLIEAERCKVHFTHSMEPYRGFNRAFHFSERHLDVLPLQVDVTWQQYVKLTEQLRERCLLCLQRLFAAAGRDPSATDNILLVGAMTRDPPVRMMLEKFFGREPSASDLCPADYAVAIGAAIRGGMLRDVFDEKIGNRVTFVRGSLQHLKDGGLLTRAWQKLTGNAGAGAGVDAAVNPNAIGHKWRGSNKGMSNAEIEKFHLEIVEFESQCQRRQMLEKIENNANQAMQRITKNNAKRQGMQEKSLQQLSEQMKFWQYMVRNFHDHEEQLERTTAEVNLLLDQLEGITVDATADDLDDEGRIDFDKRQRQAAEEKEQLKQKEESAGSTSRRKPIVSTELLDGVTPLTAAAGTRARPLTSPPTTMPAVEDEQERRNIEAQLGKPVPSSASFATTSSSSQQKQQQQEEETNDGEPSSSVITKEDKSMFREVMNPSSTATIIDEEFARASAGLPKKGRILRRKRSEVPLPDTHGNPKVRQIIEKGTAALFEDPERSPEISENTRRKLLEDYVEDRAWREPPKPPGEQGSWLEVRDAMRRGEVVGMKESETEAERTASPMEGMLQDLADGFPHRCEADELETARLASAVVDIPDSVLVAAKQAAQKVGASAAEEEEARRHREDAVTPSSVGGIRRPIGGGGYMGGAATTAPGKKPTVPTTASRTEAERHRIIAKAARGEMV